MQVKEQVDEKGKAHPDLVATVRAIFPEVEVLDAYNPRVGDVEFDWVCTNSAAWGVGPPIGLKLSIHNILDFYKTVFRSVSFGKDGSLDEAKVRAKQAELQKLYESQQATYADRTARYNTEEARRRAVNDKAQALLSSAKVEQCQRNPARWRLVLDTLTEDQVEAIARFAAGVQCT